MHLTTRELADRLLSFPDAVQDAHRALSPHAAHACRHIHAHALVGRLRIDVSYETVRRWALKFGTIIARKLRRGRPRPDGRWHLDEVFVSVNGKQLYVWRAVDSEGEVLDILVQPRRDCQAAFKLMRKLLKKQGITPATIVTDKLRSYGSALRELGVAWRHDTGRWKNNRAESSHQPMRQRERRHCHVIGLVGGIRGRKCPS